MNPWSPEGVDEMLLADPERAVGFGALGASLEIFQRWLSVFCRGG